MKTDTGRFDSKKHPHIRVRSQRVKGIFHHVVSKREDASDTEQPKIDSSTHGISKLLFDTQEAERTRIARELHDCVGQELALLIVNMQCPPASEEGGTQIQQHLVDLKAQAEKISNMVRTISHNLHPPELDYLGLKVAVESLCRRFSSAWKIQVVCNCTLPTTPERSIALAVYRVVQEALHNVAKHAHARSTVVCLASTDRELSLAISDDGSGFDLKRTSYGIGLLSMRERISAVGGSMNIRSHIGMGTTIEICLPLRAH